MSIFGGVLTKKDISKIIDALSESKAKLSTSEDRYSTQDYIGDTISDYLGMLTERIIVLSNEIEQMKRKES